MDTLNLSFKDDYVVMEFDRPKADAINERMVHEMREAGAFGLIHAVDAPEKLLEAAEAKLPSWLELPQESWREAKVTLRKSLLEAMDAEFSEGFGGTLREWRSVDSRVCLGAMTTRSTTSGAAASRSRR